MSLPSRVAVWGGEEGSRAASHAALAFLSAEDIAEGSAGARVVDYPVVGNHVDQRAANHIGFKPAFERLMHRIGDLVTKVDHSRIHRHDFQRSVAISHSRSPLSGGVGRIGKWHPMGWKVV